MRLLFAALALVLFVQTPTNAQNCQTLSVRSASGILTGTKQVCVDASGAWVDPGRVNHPSQPIIQNVIPAEPKPVVVESLSTIGAASVSQPEFQYQQVFQTIPSAHTAPLIQDIAPLTLYQEPALLAPSEYAAPPAPVVSFEGIATPVPPAERNTWLPTSGAAKRQELYAKLGLVCVAKSARFCSGNSCSGLCTRKQGWCDGKTGEIYASLEAIERVYCRKKKRR